jgi:hypothetical protein
MPYEVLDANANTGAMKTAIDDFAAGVSSVDSVEDVTKLGRDRVAITVQYTA